MNTENSTRSTLRVVSVISCFPPEQPELSMIEISRKSGISLTTTYRIVAGLTKGHLLERNATSGKYRVGRELYILGSMYLTTTDIPSAAEPVIKTLNDLTNEAVLVSILDKGHITVVMKEECKHLFRWGVHIGYSAPAYSSAMGKALLSELTDTQIDSIYPEETLQPRTKKTIATKTELKQDLDRIRKSKVAINIGGGYEEIAGIASVIRDARGEVIAAMSISLPIFRLAEANIQGLSTLIRFGCSLVSHKLGYQDKDAPVRDIEDIRSWWEQNTVNFFPSSLCKR